MGACSGRVSPPFWPQPESVRLKQTRLANNSSVGKRLMVSLIAGLKSGGLYRQLWHKHRLISPLSTHSTHTQGVDFIRVSVCLNWSWKLSFWSLYFPTLLIWPMDHAQERARANGSARELHLLILIHTESDKKWLKFKIWPKSLINSLPLII